VLIPHNDLVEAKNEDGSTKPLKIGEEITAEVANVDSQDRRLTLSMRVGEGVVEQQAAKPAEKRESRAPKKGTDEAGKGGTIGELIKQKLGEKLALEKKDEE
jgi:small subunit ribosomal protein S1